MPEIVVADFEQGAHIHKKNGSRLEMYYMKNIGGLYPGNGYDCYYYYCPEYFNWIMEKFPKLKYHNIYHCDRQEFPDIPWGKLFMRGLANIGHLGCSTCIEALLWGREDEVLRQLLDTPDGDTFLPEEYAWVSEYLAEDDWSKVESHFVQALSERIKLLPLSVTVFDNKDLFHQFFPEAERNASAIGLCGLAKSMKWLLGNEREARRLLFKAEKEAEAIADIYIVASLHKELFNDDQSARRLLEKANSKVDEICDFEHMAQYWKKLFNDDDAARQLLLDAEKKASDGPEFRWLAYAWKDILDDDSQGQRMLRESERIASDAYNLQFTGIFWNEWFGKKERAGRLLKASEKIAESVADLCNAAEWWKWILHDEEQARRVFSLAERRAEGASDIKLLTEKRHDIFGDEALPSNPRFKTEITDYRRNIDFED